MELPPSAQVPNRHIHRPLSSSCAPGPSSIYVPAPAPKGRKKDNQHKSSYRSMDLHKNVLPGLASATQFQRAVWRCVDTLIKRKTMPTVSSGLQQAEMSSGQSFWLATGSMDLLQEPKYGPTYDSQY